MATEKTINTRIQLKYSTLEEWSDLSVEGKGGNLVLKAGEVGICAVPSGSSLKQTTPPAIMFKVGDGTTAFKDLPWTSALAADVYAWAKKSVPNVSDFSDIIAAARDGLISENDVVKTLNELKGDVTIEPKTGEARISVTKNEQKIQLSFAFTDADNTVLNSGITATKVSTYDGYAATIADAKKAGTDAAAALSTYKTSNDAAVAKKVDNTITVNGHALSSNVTVTKSDVGLGNVENKALDTTVTASSGNYITSGAVKTAIDSAISGVTQFDIVKYDSFAELPAIGKKGVIYIIAHTHSDGNDSYDEYIWNTALETPAYEKIGNTDVNLDNYVNRTDTQSVAGNKTFTGMTTFGNPITCQSGVISTNGTNTLDNAGLSYNGITRYTNNAGYTLTIPLKSGTIALTSDIPGIMTGATSSTSGSKGLVPAPLAGEEAEFLRGDGSWAVPTDSKVTSAANHYTPSADSASQLSVDASSTTAATWNSTSLVTGVNIQRDAKGHVTGVTVDSIKMPTNPDTNTAHTHTKGVGLVVTGSGGTSGSVEYKVALADETLDTNAAVSRPAANANRTYPVIADKNGKLATIVPWTNTTYTTATTSAAGLMSASDKTKLDGIAASAQVNVIESITVGGTAQTPTSKTVALGAAAGKAVDTSISANSTSTNLPTSKAVEDRINAHAGIDKTGTVTSVGVSTTANGGLKVTGSPVTSSGTINIDIDDSVVFVLNCGSATVNV